MFRDDRRTVDARAYRVAFALLAMLCLLSAASVRAAESPETDATQSGPVNILLLVADDLNMALGCYGDPVAQTPNLDRLAARGVRFDRAYCQATVCNASRASIFSGLRPHTIGVLDNETPWPSQLPDVPYLPAFFQQRGFVTGTFGKNLDHKRVPEQPYWDVEFLEWGKHPDDHEMVERGALFPGASGSMYWARQKGPDEVTPDGEVAHRGAAFIEQQHGSELPFLAAVGFRRPHTPYAAPAKYFDLYSEDDLVLPATPKGYHQTLPPGAIDERPFMGDREDGLQALKAYYACVSYVDAQVGVLLDAMDRGKMWDDTVVVFLSDHGYHTGHQGRWHKSCLFEQTTRVPLIIAAPQGMSGARKQIVELIDLYPTLAHLCGLEPSDSLPGDNLAPLLEDASHPDNGVALTSLGRVDDEDRPTYAGHSLRTDRYRYTEWQGGKKGVELYDFADDPRGERNLAGNPEYSAVMASLREQLRKMYNADPPSGNAFD